MANTVSAIQDKYGAPQFQHNADGQTTCTWATGVAINVVLKDANGLVSTIGTSLTDYPAGVLAREELDVMSQRPDTRATEAEKCGKPAL